MPRRVRVAQLLVVLHAALLMTQPITAGGLLDGDNDAREAHQAVGGVLVSFVGLGQLIAIAFAARALGSWRAPILACGIWLAEVAQMALGNAGSVRVHVPLGVATVVAAAGLVVLLVGRRAPAWS